MNAAAPLAALRSRAFSINSRVLPLLIPRIATLCFDVSTTTAQDRPTHPRERRPTRGVVQDLLDDALDVAVALGRVERAERGGALAVGNVGLEDGPAPLTLSADDAAHGGCDWTDVLEVEGGEWERERE